MSNRTRWLVGLLISAVALAAAVWGIDWGKTLGALQRADFAYLALVLAVLLIVFITRAVRWRVLIGADVSLGRCWSALAIGYLANTVLPFRAGELARAYLISRRQSFGAMQALSSVALERIIDALSVVLMFGLSLPYVPIPEQPTELQQAGRLLQQGGLVTGLIALGALVAMLVAALWPSPVQRLGDRVIGRIFRHSAASWSQRLAGALAGLSVLRSPRRLAEVMFWTVATWSASIGTVYLGARAFMPVVPPATAVFVLAALGLGVSLPSSPGQVGVYEATGRYALWLTGVDEHTALAIAFALHAANLLPIIVLGGGALLQEGESLGRLAAETYAWLAGQRASRPAGPASD